MPRYETLYIVQPALADEQLDEIVRAFEEVIPTNNGRLIKTEKWGRRRLAYRIGRHWEGYYVVTEYEGDGSTQRELERRMRIHEHLMRHLTVAVDPRMDAELARRAERERRDAGRDEGRDGWEGRGRDRDRDRDRDDDDRRRPRRDDRPERGERA